MLAHAAKNNWHGVNSEVVRIVDGKTSGTTMSKIDDNDQDYQESDVVVDDKETIDMTDYIMFKNYICS